MTCTVGEYNGICLYAGDDESFEIVLIGVALPGASATLQARDRITSDVAEIDLTATVSDDGSDTTLAFSLTAAETAALNTTGAPRWLFYDVQTTYEGAARTWLAGKLQIRPEVTR